IAVHAGAGRGYREVRARDLRNEEDRSPGAVVAELDEHLRLEGSAAVLAAGETLRDPVEALGRQRLEQAGGGRIGQEMPPCFEASAVRLPARGQVDAGAGAPVVVEIDEPAGRDAADRRARHVEAAGREGIHEEGT